jgi:hypothetical protein
MVLEVAGHPGPAGAVAEVGVVLLGHAAVRLSWLLNNLIKVVGAEDRNPPSPGPVSAGGS